MAQITVLKLKFKDYNNYYFFTILSLLDLKYTGSDGIKRNTAFNGNFVANALVGKKHTMHYIYSMYFYNWNSEKNEWLKKNRNICFEDIIFLISEGNLVEIIKNPGRKYQNQFMFVINFENYVYLGPFVINENEVFLKTIISSRKATKKYIGGKNNENG